jgi:pimeloyl-ACP methyl ester carboxylesterase
MAPAAPAPSPAVSATPPPSLPAERVTLDVFLDSLPVGRESWAITRPADGSTEIAFEASLDEHGTVLKGNGVLVLAPDLTTRTATLALETPDGPVKGELHGAGAAMGLRLTRGDETREVRAEQASNLFLPQPFFAGFARACPLLEAATTALVEFPGSPLTVVDHQPLAGGDPSVTLYTIERGPLGRSILACQAGDLIAALDPWSGQSAARAGKTAVLDAMVLATTRHKPATPAGLVEEDVFVTVPANGKDVEARLACSFMRPRPAADKAPGKKAAPAARLPAVIFFSGSGPQDRDEDTIGMGGVKLSVFKTMAIALGEGGIASLRCDDRGTGQSTGVFEQATLQTFVRDGEEAVRALRLRADVDPARVGVVGHSEGAVVAPVVVRADGKVRAVLFMAAPGRPIPDIAVVQQQRMLEAAGMPKEQIQTQLAAQAEVLKAIRQGDPLPVTVPKSERARIEAQRGWLKSHFDHDPQRALREMPRAAVLVVQGAKDLQVPAEDADLVRKGLASGKNPDAQVVVYPTLNHVFAESRGGSVTEYSDPRAQIDPTFLADAVAFFRRAFGSKSPP